jgi:hypothetical protein
MAKVAILVEPDFYLKHVGVRNLIFSLYSSLIKIGHHVDFLSYQVENRSLSWFKVFFDNASVLSNFSNNNIFVEGNSVFLKEAFKADHFIISEQAIAGYGSDPVFVRIGSSLEYSGYSNIIVSAPWALTNEIFPLSAKLHGIVHDMIPNNYVFDKKDKPFHFSYFHLNGYDLYNRYCCNIWSNSCSTNKAYDSFFSAYAEKSLVLPPAVPAYLREKPVSSKVIRDNNIVLAGPWDPRKGLYRLPNILNSITSPIDTLFIYGKPRCADSDVLDFFASLRKDINIIWFKEISNSKLREVYCSSKVLIFPSENEGLGLPLIEAQLNGCRVVCTPFDSATEILVSGFQIVDNNDVAAAAIISSMLQEDFDYEALRYSSESFFSEEKTEHFLNSVLSNLD